MGFKPCIKNSFTAPYGVLQHLSKAVVVIFLLMCQPAFADRPTVLALGDSLTQGYGLAHDNGFVPQLTQWLSDNGTPAEIINGGVSGDTTAGGLERVEWSLSDDVDAMIVALGSNDMLRGIAPEDSHHNLAQILEIGQNRGLKLMLIGVRATGNFGPDYKQKFDAIFPDLAQRYQAIYEDSFFTGIMDPDKPKQPILGLLQSDRMHPNVDGIRKVVETLGPTVQQLIISK